jgi:hypothetical protein
MPNDCSRLGDVTLAYARRHAARQGKSQWRLTRCSDREKVAAANLGPILCEEVSESFYETVFASGSIIPKYEPTLSVRYPSRLPPCVTIAKGASQWPGQLVNFRSK